MEENVVEISVGMSAELVRWWVDANASSAAPTISQELETSCWNRLQRYKISTW